MGIEDAQDLILDLEQAIKAGFRCLGSRKSPGTLESASLWQLSVIKKGKGLEFHGVSLAEDHIDIDLIYIYI